MRPFAPLLLALPLVGCPPAEPTPPEPPPADPYSVPVGPYDVELRWTSYGVPHIRADDYGSLAYGMGWAQAHDHACALYDQLTMARSERARYFGPGTDDTNIDSDFGWLSLDLRGHAERNFLSLDADIQAALVGWAAGLNRYLAETGVDNLPEPCRGQDWARPVDHIDLLSYMVALAEYGSGAVLREAIAQAEPPDGGREPHQGTLTLQAIHDRLHGSPLGSNGWALGRDLSSTTGGLVLGNPHFPHFGERRWWESHLMLGDDMDVYGASILGVPLINIGFNDHIAWTHTVSGSPRFTIYRLTLDPEDPTRYERNGAFVDLTSRDFEVQVLQADGTLATRRRTLWRSHHGPLLIFGPATWTATSAYALADANEGNLSTATTWLGMNRARSLAEFEDALGDAQGIPWVHTLAADAEGNAFFADAAATPHLDDEARSAYDDWLADSSLARQAADLGVLLFDGSNPAFDWEVTPGTRLPGLVPYAQAPKLTRSDFVANANDNHWLTNPAEPLEGELWVYGRERTPRSARTRMNLRYLTEPNGEAGADNVWDAAELMADALSSRGLVAEELRDAIVARCTPVSDITIEYQGDDRTVDVTDACAVLTTWDGRSRPGSRGSALWREFLYGSPFNGGSVTNAGALFANPFDPVDPVATPNGLAPAPADGPDPIIIALAEAVLRLNDAGVGLGQALSEVQWMPKNADRIGIGGGLGREGLIAIATASDGDGTLAPRVQDLAPETLSSSGLRPGGYPVTYGNSYMFAVQFGDEGPAGQAILTYSQSADPASPHFDDQTRLYGTGAARPILFHDEDIDADPELRVDELTHPGE